VQRGSLKVVKDRHGMKVWRLQWRENGRGRTRILGRCADMSRGDAESERRKILNPLNARVAAAVTSPVTLRRFVEDEYLTVKTRVWKASTRSTTEQLIEKYILQDLGGRTLPSITRKELQAHLDRHAEALKLSASIVGHIRWQLKAIFEMAEADQLVVKSPANGLVMPNCKDAAPKRTITADDVLRGQLVLPIRERLIFRLAVCEGLRPGEIVGLQIGDFHPDGTLHISRRSYGGRIDTPKSRRSRRVIPATAATRALIGQWLDLLKNQLPDEWLFPSETGVTPLLYTNVLRRSIRPALQKISLGHATFQVLRRTWVTEFSAAEKDPAIRAQLAGHTVDVHENEYRQPDLAAQRKAMRKLEKRLQ
jgi:integrase